MVVSNHSEELGWDNKTLKCFLAGLPSVVPNGFGRKKKTTTSAIFDNYDANQSAMSFPVM